MSRNVRPLRGGAMSDPSSVPEGFQLEDDGYNPHKEYTRSRDSIAQGGHGTDRQIKFPETLHAATMELIAEKNIPDVKTFDAAVRSALYHWVKSRNQMTFQSDEIEFILKREAWEARLDSNAQHMRANLAVFEKYKANCYEAATNGEWVVAVELVMQGRMMAAELPEPNGSKILQESKILEAKLPAEHLPHLRALEGLSDIPADAYSHARIWR